MRRLAAAALLVPLVATALTGAALAAPGDWTRSIKAVPAPAGAEGVPLPVSHARPGPQPHEAWATDGRQRMLYNVSRPALIPLSPATGPAAPAVILVPGGGFEFLSMDNEGWQVAERLKPLGVRVFILKYRTLALPDSLDGFIDAIAFTFAGKPRAQGPIDMAEDVPYAVADAQAALRSVRANAARWGVDPARVGLLGFSAGAVTSLALTQAHAADARPDFLGLIYGPTAGAAPPNAPPLFSALAADDRFFNKQDFSLIESWRRQGAPVEFHLYSGGGHGFASQPNGTTSDGWFDAFARWLNASRLSPGGAAAR